MIELSDLEVNFCSFKEVEDIMYDVELIILYICNNLKIYRMFYNCMFLKIGSIYEGFKIGRFDEFDFMIVLFVLVDDCVL